MKADIIAAATGKSKEPFHTGLMYDNVDLGRALNHYNAYAAPESLKLWALNYLRKNHPDLVKRNEKRPLYAFGTYGALCRLTERGFNLTDAHKQRIVDYFTNVPENKEPPKEEPEPQKPSRVRCTRSREAYELALDETLVTNQLVVPSFIMSESLKDIVDEVQKLQRELIEAPEYFTKDSHKLLTKFAAAVLAKLEKTRSIKKASSPNISKNPLKQVASLKLCRSMNFGDQNIRGVDAVDVIGRKKVYVYDTKYRKLMVFVALTSQGLQFSGTTLKNADLTKSFSKTIRKPEQFFKTTKLGITELNKAFADINAKPTQMIASRFNSNWIILRVTEKGA